MIGIATLVAAATIGVEVGWQPFNDRQLEYIIRIEPQLIDAMQRGEAVTSAIPPHLHDVGRYRIVIDGADGTDEPLPRIDLPERPPDELDLAAGGTTPNDTGPPVADSAEAGDTPGAERQAVDDGEVQPAGAQWVLPNTQEVDPENESFPSSDDSIEEPAKMLPGRVAGDVDDVSRPWWVWSLALVGLCVSLGANVFLGWITIDTRARYRSLLLLREP